MKSNKKHVAVSHKKRIFTSLIAVFLLAVTLISAPLAFSVKAGGQIQAQKLYDYSHSGSPINKTIDTVGLVEFYLASVEEQMTSAERKFVESFGRITLTYCDVITTDKIRFSYNDSTEILTVTPEKYSYTAKDGELTWVPVTVTVKGDEKALVNGSAEFPLDKDSYGTAEIEVVYNASAPLAASEINEIINLYHDTAKYSYEIEEYKTKKILYSNYVRAKRIYDDALAEYNEYLKELEYYESATDKYEKYLEAMEEYTEKQKEYLRYVSELEVYEENRLIYEKYVEALGKMEEQLKTIEIAKTPMTDKRTLFAAVMGSTVDSVLENKSVFTSSAIGADPAVIDLAGDATERTRNLLNNYFACKTVFEKYTYYTVNYEKLCSAFKDLTIALDELYQNRKVSALLVKEGKNEKYLILVAQLALVTGALIDGDVLDYDGNIAYNSQWKIADKTISEILENKTYITDTNEAKPISDSVSSEVEEPKAPSEVAVPVLPQKVQRPIKPDEVVNPGEAPEPVEDALPPTPTTNASELVYYSLSAEDRLRLSSAYVNENLTARYSAEGLVIPLRVSVKREIAAEQVNVTFVNEAGEFICSATSSAGSAVIYEGAQQFKAEDEFYSYKFVGWQDESGKTVNLSSIDKTAVLSPIYQKQPKYYDVTWIVEGEMITQRLPADTVPECPIPLKKADEGSHMYVFAGWDKPIEPVSKSITYTALFEKRSILSVGKRHAEISDDGRVVTCSSYGDFTNRIFISELLLRYAENRAITINTSYAIIEFTYAQVIALSENGVDSIKINTVQRGGGSYSYTVELYDSLGAVIEADIGCALRLPCSFVGSEYAVLFTEDGSNRKYVKFDALDTLIGFSAICGKTYIAQLEYEITVAAAENLGITCDKMSAAPGERVRVNVDLPKGMELSRFIITTSDAQEIKLDTDSTFIMPKGDVTVGAVTKVKMYTVTFIAAGKVIASYRLAHGEAITPPLAPKLENDSKYSYEFVSWNAEIGTAVGNAEYVAIYRSQLLPEKPKEPAIVVSDSIMRLIVTALAVAATFLFAVIPSTVIGIVLIRKHKRMKINPKSKE